MIPQKWSNCVETLVVHMKNVKFQQIQVSQEDELSYCLQVTQHRAWHTGRVQLRIRITFIYQILFYTSVKSWLLSVLFMGWYV